MFRSLSVAATGMAAQQARLEGISHNISNSNTVGFKRQRLEFQDLLYQVVRAPGTATGQTTEAPVGIVSGSGVRLAGTVSIQEQGTYKTTNNSLDVAIEGKGFLSVQREDGTLAYTRAGTLKTDSTGRLVNSDGLPIDPPITIPVEASDITIASTGKVTATMTGEKDPVELGQITTATFVNPSGLLPVGHNLFERTIASGEPMFNDPGSNGHGTLLQGSLEESNVDMVEEMVSLITTQRSYEINSRVVSSADQMLQSATEMSR